MEKITFDLEKYTKKGAPHELAYYADYLCQQLGLPFCTVMLRAVKTNRIIAEETVAYMRGRKISNLNYFVKVFYAKVKNK